MPEVFYLIPKQGDGSLDNSVRPRYLEGLAGLAGSAGVRFARRLDDPFSFSGGVGLYALVDSPDPQIAATLEGQPGVILLGNNVPSARTGLRRMAADHQKVQRWLRQYPTDQDLEQVLRLRRARRRPLGQFPSGQGAPQRHRRADHLQSLG